MFRKKHKHAIVCHLPTNSFTYPLIYSSSYTHFISRLCAVVYNDLMSLQMIIVLFFAKDTNNELNSLTFDIKKQLSRSANSNCARKNNKVLHSNQAVRNYSWLVGGSQ